MLIELGDGWFLGSDEYNVIVGKRKSVVGKKDSPWVNPSYFATIPAALRFVLSRQLAASEAASVEELIERFANIRLVEKSDSLLRSPPQGLNSLNSPRDNKNNVITVASATLKNN